LECGALSPLWPAAAWRRNRGWNQVIREKTHGHRGRAKPQPAKAPTTGVPGAAAALGWRGGALQGGAPGPGGLSDSLRA
jgi:hypothetical protein